MEPTLPLYGRMGFWQKIREAFSNDEQEAPYSAIIESRRGVEDLKREGYRLYNQSLDVAFGRDFSPEKQSKMQRIAKKLHDSTALGQRIVDIRKNLLTSEGFQIEPKGPQIRKNKELSIFFDKFWKDNQFDLKLDDYIKDILIYGEVCFYVPNVNPFNGRAKLVWISPENIESIEADSYDLTEPDVINLNSEIVISEIVDGERVDKKTKTLKAIRENSDGQLVGNAFYFALNKTIGGMRGVCDFIHVADWIDVHKQIISSETDRVEFSKAFIFRCAVDGGETAVAGVIDRHSKPPTGGSVLVHSDKEEWSVLQPQLTLFDTTNFSTHLVEMILGGMGIPMAWYFDNSGSNNSSSTEMTKPIFTWAMKSKLRLCAFFKKILTFLIQEARKDFGPFGKFTDEDCEFDVISRNPDRGAYDEIAAMCTAVGESLNLGVSSGWLENEVAGDTFRKIMRTLNLGEISDPRVTGVNWNVEVIKAKANQQVYENIQKEEGKANLISRLFAVDVNQKLSGENPIQISNTIQEFLKKAFAEQLAKAKKDVLKKEEDASSTLYNGRS